MDSKKRQKKKKKIRPETIIISKKGDMSCPDIFRKFKAEPELINLGRSISHIRGEGNLMLELNKSSEKTADSCLRAIEKGAEMKARKQQIVIACKDPRRSYSTATIPQQLVLAISTREF